ncbi:MAG: AAA family ATPase, partial [Rhodothermales bacterium]
MLSLPDYVIIEQIHKGTRSHLFRARHLSDESTVVIKIHATEFPRIDDLNRFRHEYAVGKDISSDHVVTYCGLELYDHRLALVLEDVDGVPLADLTPEGGLEVFLFLQIALQLAQGLGTIHRLNVIHKDIHPRNILFNPNTSKIKIIDFGIASRGHKETPATVYPNRLEGRLAYISPEQTGRMNRVLDYRTDYYSLGITLYELLTGRLPFEARDPMELVHSHIAKTPTAPDQRDERIPRAVSGIIMKLLEKNAEDRYLSSEGLVADLERCLHELETGDGISDFAPGASDFSPTFRIPQKLYGRKRELQVLSQTLERAGGGDAEMLLVTGYSGIGKSALVNEIQKPTSSTWTYFTFGKYDQLNRNVAYSAITQAFRGLVRQILGESEQRIAHWKRQLSTALGINSQVIVDVVPEIELIIGEQEPVQELGPAETQNRFHQVFQQFVRVFAHADHPLALFLDDLQWADPASLNLISHLLVEKTVKHLLLIGAYRDNEVDATHPLALALKSYKQNGAVIHEIHLKPLDLAHLTSFIADTLHCSLRRARPLARMIRQKTRGNPFFVNQFLKTLYQDKLLVFSLPSQGEAPGRWEWDIAEIEATTITDNVVDLMVKKIKTLPPQTQKALRLAACVGNYFDLDTLSIVHEKTAVHTMEDILPAVREELILPMSESNTERQSRQYKFLHDRVQQAAYTLIPDDKKHRIHLNIGRLLLKDTPEETLDDKLFSIVNHLNIGRRFVTEADERLRLATLNLRAGNKAKESTAYQAAIGYLDAALDLLPEDTWHTQYALTYEIHVGKAECAYLATNFDDTLRLFEIITTHARSKLELARIYILIIVLYTNLGEMAQAVDYGRKAVALFGVEFPRDSRRIQQAVTTRTARIQRILAEKSIENLVGLPEMTDPEKKALLDILVKCVPPSYQTQPGLVRLIITTMVETSLEYGNTSFSAYGYDMYAILVGELLEEYGQAYRLGQVAMQLVNAFNDIALKGAVYFVFANFVSHWGSPLRESLDIFIQGFNASIEGGDHIHTGYCASRFVVYSIFQGERLDLLLKEGTHYADFLVDKKDLTCSQMVLAGLQVIRVLRGKTASTTSLDGPDFSEPYFEETFQDNLFSLSHFYVLKGMLAYLFGHLEQALQQIERAGDVMHGTVGSTVEVEYNFYHSLVLCRHPAPAGRANQEKISQQIQYNQRKLRVWADCCPANYRHKYLLIEAEIARLLGNDLDAQDLYDQAVESARNSNFLHIEALANELAARYWLDKGKGKIAGVYLREAHYGYSLWGATAKAAHLERTYLRPFSQTLADLVSSDLFAAPATTTLSAPRDAFLDFTTVTKAAQAISEEIVLEKLLQKLMRIVIENAGAQKGILILQRDDQLLIEAIARADSSEVDVLQSILLDECLELAQSVVHYAVRTRENLVLRDAVEADLFNEDPYIVTHRPRSILCTPIHHKDTILGILYLENNLAPDAFTEDRIEVMHVLLAQAAISLENAFLYEDLQREITERKHAEAEREELITELEAKNTELERFTYTVSHDLKSPLVTIKGFLGYLREDAANDNRQRMHADIEQIASAADKMQQLLNELLELSRIGRLVNPPEAVSMATLAHEAVDL